jgi:hypothetical protein
VQLGPALGAAEAVSLESFRERGALFRAKNVLRNGATMMVFNSRHIFLGNGHAEVAVGGVPGSPGGRGQTFHVNIPFLLWFIGKVSIIGDESSG